jgi:predicted amidohydrolase YtcJ
VLPDADALAIAGGRIVAVGREADLAPLKTRETQVVDAGRATVTPGLCDAHVHLLAWARARHELNLEACRTRADALIRVGRHLAENPGEATLIGRGWKSDAWEAPPEANALDAVTGDRPVILHGRDFHSVWVNGAVLRRAGIDARTPDPDGGRIERDASGVPTGVLREHAVRLVAPLERAAAAVSPDALASAIGELHAHGVTAVHDFEDAEAFHALRAVTRGEHAALRVLMHLPHSALDHALATGLESGVGDDAFRIGAVKLFADGTLGSRTAALLDPYDGTDERGLDLISDSDLKDAVRRAFRGGLSIAVHAIGDRAVRRVLDAFEASRDALARLALPPRIEHVQLIAADDVPRFAWLGIAASVQPSHALSDVGMAERWWSARAHRSYAWRSLADGGALLAFGSDAPVEPPHASFGLMAAVARRGPGAASAFVPEQRIELDRALVAYTRGGALLSGTWPRTGCLSPGAWADFVVWDGDLHALAPEELGAARPSLTAIAGEVVHRDAASLGSSGTRERRVLA